MVFACPRCGAEFATTQKLQRHLSRKRPCDPVLDGQGLPYICHLCGRGYSRPDSVKRHLAACPLAVRPARTDPAPQYEHALRQQAARFETELAKRDAAMAEIAARLERLAAAAPPQSWRRSTPG